MHVSSSFRPSVRPSTSRPLLLTIALLATLSACGGGSSGGGQSGIPGEPIEIDTDADGIPDHFAFVDANHSGSGARLHIAEVLWGRLVDVHDIDASGATNPTPIYTDFVIEPDVFTSTDYVLERNPVTQRERLVVKDTKGIDADDDADQEDPFLTLVRAASDQLPVVAVKHDNGTSAPPFSSVPRNACVVVRFDDCLDSSDAAEDSLSNTVLVLGGYPPSVPIHDGTRRIFDPNHGAVLNGDFFSTRVLIDLTVSEAEAQASRVPLTINPVGAPASLSSSAAPNVSIHIPSQIDPGSGQFEVLTNIADVSLSANDNGPVDRTVPTLDVVRAFKSGNSADASNGFLNDLDRPRVIGSFPLDVDAARDAAGGEPGVDLELDLTFNSVCQNAPAVGDVVAANGALLEVVENGTLNAGSVVGLKVRSLTGAVDPLALAGTGGNLQLPFDPALTLDLGCWLTFIPEPATLPATGIQPNALVRVRFSEPMDPDTVSTLENFLVVNGASDVESTATTANLVVGDLLVGNDLDEFTFDPRLPMPHQQGTEDPLHIELSGPRDLAGNRLRHTLPFVDFKLADAAATAENGSIVLRFNAADEVGEDTKDDLRGQFFYDFSRGVIRPRPVAFSGWPADRTNLVPGAMVPPPPGTLASVGVFAPLSPLGARLQSVWRYCDFNWDLTDETKFNLDVVGLNWAPVGGQVVADFFELFEMRLGHSRYLPDECLATTGLPSFNTSGLQNGPAPFEGNFLVDSFGVGVPVVLHNRALGYNVNPALRFLSTTATTLIPYPLNRGPGVDHTYTWRDTALIAQGGDGHSAQPGVPTCAEVVAGLQPTGTGGSVAPQGAVPSFGLPLLIEIRCYPTTRGIGLNKFEIIQPPTVSSEPNFRVYSVGGVDTAQRIQLVDPDRALSPTGSFNPFSAPPGKVTPYTGDNLFYVGQLDTVVRVSRVHTIWLDTGTSVLPSWKQPILDPPLDSQPQGTDVVLDFRAVSSFIGAQVGNEFDARLLDPYGELDPANRGPNTGLTDWSNSIFVGNGLEFLQVRITFVNNVQTGLAPELKALALPFEKL